MMDHKTFWSSIPLNATDLNFYGDKLIYMENVCAITSNLVIVTTSEKAAEAVTSPAVTGEFLDYTWIVISVNFVTVANALQKLLWATASRS